MAAGSMVANSSNETQPTQMLQNILGGPRAASTNSNASSPFARRVSPRQAPSGSVYVSDETQGVYESQIGDDDTQSQKENAPRRRTLPNTRSRPVSPIKPPRAKKNKPLTPQPEITVAAVEEDHSLPPPPSRGRSELSVMDQLALSPEPDTGDDSVLLSQVDGWDTPAQAAAAAAAPPPPSPPRVKSPPILSSQSQSQSQDYQPTQPLIVPDSQPEAPQPPPVPALAPPPPQPQAPSLAHYAAQRKQRHDAPFPKFGPLNASSGADETQLGGSDGNTQPAPVSQDMDVGSTQPLGGDGATQPLGGTQPLDGETQPATQPSGGAGAKRAVNESDVLSIWKRQQSRHGTGHTAAEEETQPLEDDILNATPGQIPGLGSTQVREEGETQFEETQVDPVPSSRITSVRDPGLEIFNRMNQSHNVNAGPTNAGPSTQRAGDALPRQRNTSGPMPRRDDGLDLYEFIKNKERRSAPPSAPTQAEAEPDSIGSDETRATHGGSSPQRGRRDSGETDIVPDSLASSMPAPVSNLPAKRPPPLINPDSESEEDVPLMRQVAKSRSESPPNKRRRIESLPVVPEDKSLSISDIRAQKGKDRQEDEGVEVPSSVPHEDKTPAPSLPNSKNKGKGKARATSNPSTRASSRGKSVTPAATTDGYDPIFVGSLSPPPASQDPLDLIPKMEKGQPMDVDEAEDVKPQISSTAPRKRKRSGAPPARNTRAKSRIPSGTPKAGPSRLRGNASTGRRHGLGEPTRVFALWKADGLYYPGTVHSQEGSQYLIHFDDSTSDYVPLECLRRLALEPGDKVIHHDTNAVVVEVHGNAGVSPVQVKFIAGKDKDETEDTKVNCLQIHPRSISAQWRERTLKGDEIVPIERPSGVENTPTPSRASTLDNPHYLSNIAFIITLSNTGHERAQAYDKAVRTIKRHGGVVLEEWSDLYQIPCASDNRAGRGDGRWAWDPAGFKFKPKAAAKNVDRVFLIADGASHKVKYMVALALGVPCLNLTAVDDSKFDKVWQSYLLPAGFSTTLNAKVSQLIDYDWGTDITHMSDIMNTQVVDDPPVALRPFCGKRMLIVGQEFAKTGRKTSGNAGEEYSIPEIMLCAGAARVVSRSEMPEYVDGFDFAVVKDPAAYEVDGEVPVVSTAWVKDCIISGRLHAP